MHRSVRNLGDNNAEEESTTEDHEAGSEAEESQTPPVSGTSQWRYHAAEAGQARWPPGGQGHAAKAGSQGRSQWRWRSQEAEAAQKEVERFR